MPGSGGGKYPKFAVIITMRAPDGNQITFPFIEYANDGADAKQNALSRFKEAKDEGADVYSDRVTRV